MQEIGTLSGLTVAENIFLGNEDRFTKYGVKNTAAMNRQAQEYLNSYGFSYIDASRTIDDYNFEDRKLIEIVKSTYFNRRCLWSMRQQRRSVRKAARAVQGHASNA